MIGKIFIEPHGHEVYINSLEVVSFEVVSRILTTTARVDSKYGVPINQQFVLTEQSAREFPMWAAGIPDQK